MPDAGAPACPAFRTTTERRTCPPWTTEGVRTWTPETDRSGRFAAWAPAGSAHARSEATRAVALTVDRLRRCIGDCLPAWTKGSLRKRRHARTSRRISPEGLTTFFGQVSAFGHP